MNRRTFLARAGGGGAIVGLPGLPFAAPAQSRTELLLGQSAVLSGPLGEQVRLFNDGARLVFEQVNAAGGVMGRRLKFVSIDDQLQPPKAQAAVRELLRQKAVALFGCVGTPTTSAIEPLLRESGVPAIGGYAVADSVRRKCQGAAYFVRAGYGRETAAIAQHVATVGLKRVAIAHLASPGGDEALTQLREALQALKIEPVVSAAVTTDGLNVSEAAKKLGTLKPDAVVMFLGGPLAAGLMAGLSALGLQPSYYGLSIVTGEQVSAKLGARARGLILSQAMPSPWHPSEPAALDYRRLAQAAKLGIGYAGYEGYVTARVMVEALYRCSTDLTPSRLHTVMSNMRWRHASLDLDFTQDGTGSRFVELVQLTEQGGYLR